MKKISFKQKIVLIIFGVCLCVVLLEVGLRIGGFIILSLQEHRNRVSLRQGGTYRILCLGESTTMGQWPSPLEEILNQKNTGIKFSVIDKGIAGTNTRAIVSLLKDNLNKYKPDMVITMMGINDEKTEGNIARKSGLFIESFKVYKMMNLLKRRIANKITEIKPRILKNKNGLTENDKSSIYIKGGGEPLAEKYIRLSESYIKDGEHYKAKEALEKAIDIVPNNEATYIELGVVYKHWREYNKTEELFKKAIELNPKYIKAYIMLAQLYHRQLGDYKRAEEVFEKIIDMDQNNYIAYLELGYCYSEQGFRGKAKEMFKKAMLTDHKERGLACVELGILYRNQRRWDLAEKLFRKAMEINPKRDFSYLALASMYNEDMGLHDEAEKMFRKAIELKTKDENAYIGLSMLYKDMGGREKAEEIFTEAINVLQYKERLYSAISLCYKEWGEPGLAEEYSRKKYQIKTISYNPKIRRNYRRLKKKAFQRGIELVCVQYPMRDVGLLKGMFEDTGGIVFVDNEKIFKEAVEKRGWDEYFTDCFAGDFGHCTPNGNRVLAENIADTILKEYF